MLEKYRQQYKDKLAVKMITIIAVVITSMAMMIPIMKLALLLGIDLRKNGGLNLEVNITNIILFFLFATCVTLVIWAAQKFIHKAELTELGFQGKIFKPLLIGFLFGVIQVATGYGIMALNSEAITYSNLIPNEISIWKYAGYYIYFIFGFLVLNSYVEELVTRAYPIEKLREHINPHIIFTIMGLIFTAGHFISRDFTVAHGLSLFIYSYTLSLVYHYSKSIWLVIGLHSGINWLVFSFFGTNWKLGALAHIEISGMPLWMSLYIQPIIGAVVLILVVFLHKKDFFKKLCA